MPSKSIFLIDVGTHDANAVNPLPSRLSVKESVNIHFFFSLDSLPNQTLKVIHCKFNIVRVVRVTRVGARTIASSSPKPAIVIIKHPFYFYVLSFSLCFIVLLTLNTTHFGS